MIIDRLSTTNYQPPQPNSGREELKVNPVSTVKNDLKHEPERNLDSFPQVPKEKLEEFVQEMNKFFQPSNTSLKFEFHEKLNEYYVKIVDDKTQETVREIPPKKLLDMYAAMTEFIGLLVDKKI